LQIGNWVKTRQNSESKLAKDKINVANSVHTADTDKTRQDILSCPSRRCEI